MRPYRSFASFVLLLLAASTAACSKAAETPQQRDVILITIDSLRADRPGFMGGKVATPAMDALASGAAVFTQALSPVPQTLPSLASLHTGLYPPAHGARDDGRSRLDEGKETLAAILKKAGYATAAFPGALALHPKYGLDRGFDTYAESFAEIPRPSASPAIGIPATRIVDKTIEWLGSIKPGQPFFLWVNFFDPHFFYEPPSPFKEQYRDQPYDGEIAYVDRELGRLTRWLADHGRETGAVIVLSGNHGEGLGDGGEQYHGILLREPTLRVPLLIRAGSASPGAGSAAAAGPSSRVDDPVSLVDVAPTILELSGAGTPAGMQGVTLAGYLGRGAKPDPSRAIYFETTLPRTLFGWAPLRGIRSGALKYVEAPGLGRPEMYDLASDPAESKDLASSRADDARRLAAEAERIGTPESGRSPSLPPAIAEVVRSLGYSIEPPPPPSIHPATKVAAGNAALQGRRAIQRQMPQAANTLLQEALKQDPENYLAVLTFASMSIGARDFYGAEALLKRAQVRYPADAEIYHVLGHLQISMARGPQDLERAGRIFELTVRLDPMNEEALYDSACFAAGADQDLALNYLASAVKMGYRDFRHMAMDADMNPIRGTERFREITGGKAVAPEGPATQGRPGGAPATPPGS